MCPFTKTFGAGASTGASNKPSSGGQGKLPLLTGNGLGSMMLRRLVPGAMFVLLLVTGLRGLAERWGWLSAQQAAEWARLADIGGLALLACAVAVLLNRKDQMRRQAEGSLRKSEEKYRGLLEAAPDAMVIVDHSGRIVLINSQMERLFGYGRNELEGEEIEVLLPVRLRERHVQHRSGFFEQARSRPMGAGLELYGRHRDGREFPVEISLSPLQTEEGMLVTSAIRDVTERKRFEKDLQEASRMKSEFLANMSHELRTPLNGIIGFSEFLVDQKPGKLNSKQVEYISDVLNSARHLLGLINDILDLAKVEAGKMELTPEAFLLKPAVEEVCSVLKNIAEGKQIRMTVALSPELSVVTLDPQRFRQVLFNLGSNAIKFTEPGGSVEIACRPQGAKQFALEVKDTGMGIKPEDIGRLFRHFEQLEAVSTRQQGGTGLGLVLTKRIVEMHHGEVLVQSEFGKGSTFTALFPRSNGSPTQTE